MKNHKTIISIILAVIVIFALTISAGALTKYIRGDVDGDGVVTVLDVATLQRHLVGVKMTAFDKIAADVDGRGLDIFDVTLIQRYLANLNNPYNIGKTFTYDEYELPIV